MPTRIIEHANFERRSIVVPTIAEIQTAKAAGINLSQATIREMRTHAKTRAKTKSKTITTPRAEVATTPKPKPVLRTAKLPKAKPVDPETILLRVKLQRLQSKFAATK
jgi:hypothetical protein